MAVISSSAEVRVFGLASEFDRVGAVDIGEHEDGEEFGARSRPAGVQVLS